jgi:hypothetical protein
MFDYFTKTTLFNQKNKKEIFKNMVALFGIPRDLAKHFKLKPKRPTKSNKKYKMFREIPKKYRQTILGCMLRMNPKNRSSCKEIAKFLKLKIKFVPLTTQSQQKQKTILPKSTLKNRKKLFGLLCKLAKDENLHNETLFLAFELIDRYLDATQECDTETLELVCIASLRLSSKFFEFNACQFQMLEFSPKQIYEICKYEKKILCKLKWCIYTESYYVLLKKYIPDNVSRRFNLAKSMYKQWSIAKQTKSDIKKTLDTIFSCK